MKETFYFSHDYGARNDPKIVKLFIKWGQAGKGVYWDLIEMLYEQKGYLLISDIDSYAFSLRTETVLITSLIKDFGLFGCDGEKFWSESVLRRLEDRKSKSQKARESVEKRWKNTNVIRTYNEGNTDVLQPNDSRNTIKESKGEEIKGKESKEEEKKEKEEAPAVAVEVGDPIEVSIPIKIGKEKTPPGCTVPPSLIAAFGIDFSPHWERWKEYKKKQHRFTYKHSDSENGAASELIAYSGGDIQKAISIINRSISKGWKGLFELNEKDGNGRTITTAAIIPPVPKGGFGKL